jgi:hypothetical protein
MRINRAIGFTNDQVFAETHDWLLNLLSGISIQPVSTDLITPQQQNPAESPRMGRPRPRRSQSQARPLHDNAPVWPRP